MKRRRTLIELHRKSPIKDLYDDALVAEALKAAKEADKTVIFAGLPDSFESEGYDRSHMRLPDC